MSAKKSLTCAVGQRQRGAVAWRGGPAGEPAGMPSQAAAAADATVVEFENPLGGTFETEDDLENPASPSSDPPTQTEVQGGKGGNSSVAAADAAAGISNLFSKINGFASGRLGDEAESQEPPDEARADRTFARLYQLADYKRQRSLQAGHVESGFRFVNRAWRNFYKYYPRDTLMDLLPERETEENLLGCEEWILVDWKGPQSEPGDDPGSWAGSSNRELPGLMAHDEFLQLVLPCALAMAKQAPNGKLAWGERLSFIQHCRKLLLEDPETVAAEQTALDGLDQAAITKNEKPHRHKLHVRAALMEGADQHAKGLTFHDENDILEVVERAETALGNRDFTVALHGFRKGLHMNPRNKKLNARLLAGLQAAQMGGQLARLIFVLGDRYLEEVVLPQLESWCSLFVTFDLRRNGVVMFSELEQGLATACSPEVAIMSSSKMVGDVMEAMAFVGKREEIIELITQISNSLNSLAAKYTSGIKFLRGNPHTSRILHDIDQVALALRQTIASRHAEKMLNLDGHLYIFKTSCQALVRWITSYIQANGDGLRLQAYSKNLAALQTHCRTALKVHAKAYTWRIQQDREPAQYASYEKSQKYLKRKFAHFRQRKIRQLIKRLPTWKEQPHAARASRQARQRYLEHAEVLLRRVWMLAGTESPKELSDLTDKQLRQFVENAAHFSFSLVAHDDDFNRKFASLKAKVDANKDGRFTFSEFVEFWREKQKAREKRWITLWPLIRFQARARGVLSLRRLFGKGNQAQGKKKKKKDWKQFGEPVVGYYNWTGVLLRFLEFCVDLDSLHAGSRAIFTVKAAKKMDDDEADNSDEIRTLLESKDEWTQFPQILLTGGPGGELNHKLKVMRTTLHSWNQLIMMLDENESGQLSILELRSALMTFSTMGLISEMQPQVPMDSQYSGWTATVSDESLGSEYWQHLNDKVHSHLPVHRRHNSLKSIKSGQELPDFPITLSDGDVVLCGHQGIRLEKCWAITLEFCFVPPANSKARNHSDFSVLLSSYNNNALVARYSQNSEGKDGFSLYFVPRHVFEEPTQIYERLQQIAEHEDRKYEVVPWLAPTPDTWHYMQIEGEQLASGSNVDLDGVDKQDGITFTVRIDPFDQVWGAHRGKDHQLKPVFHSYWEGTGEFTDCYSFGNIFDNLCSNAPDDINWSIGALRNLQMFSINRSWTHFDGAVHKWGSEINNQNAGDLSPRSDDHQIPDLRKFLWEAMSHRNGEVIEIFSGHRTTVISGLYRLAATLSRRKRKDTAEKICKVTLINKINVDHEPGFPFSTDVVYRNDIQFMDNKREKTSALTKALLSSFPSPKDNTKLQLWQLQDNWEMDANTLFIMRGNTARLDPGLNVLFTGKQLRSTMKHMQRNIRINTQKFHKVFYYFIFPVHHIWVTLRHEATHKANEKKHTPVEIIFFRIRKETGKTPQVMVLGGSFMLWMCLCCTVLGHASTFVDTIIHRLEVMLAAMYYIWAAILVSLRVSTEIKALPSDVPYSVASKQAQLSSLQITLTQIFDGQRVLVSGMGFLQMVCQLHTGEDEEDEEEEEEEEEEEDEGGDDDEELFNVGRATLDLVWHQHPLAHAMPFASDDVTRATSFNKYRVWEKVANVDDWNDNDNVMAMGMQTRIDLGTPTAYGERLILLLAAANTSLGCILRITGSESFDMDLVFGQFPGPRLVTLVCAITTFISSWFVYRTIFCTAFQWYTALTFMQQMATVLSITGATRDHIPCYIDLRHEGNLEGWYLAREYLCALNDATVFGIKDQIIVFSALVVSAFISVNAISSYFGDDEVDWSNPGPLTSLLNMQIIGGLLFLSLVALERMNNETSKLLKKLDLVAIEVSRVSSVEQSTSDRQKYDGSANNYLADDMADMRARLQKRANEDSRASLELGFTTMLTDIQEVKDGVVSLDKLIGTVTQLSQQMISRMEISTEYQYLQNIITELRDQTDNKKILGLVIDRIMLGRIFGGVVAVMYIILKEFADQMITQAKRLTPMGTMLSAGGIEIDEDGATGADSVDICDAIDGSGVAVLEALNFSVSCVQQYCAPACNASAIGG